MTKLISYAKELRKNSTAAEKLLWHHLRAKQIITLKFRRQQAIGNYIVDFVCFERKLIIELDGGQHGEETGLRKDQERDRWLQSQGFKILRFWNNEIFKNIDGVLEKILERTLTLP